MYATADVAGVREVRKVDIDGVNRVIIIALGCGPGLGISVFPSVQLSLVSSAGLMRIGCNCTCIDSEDRRFERLLLQVADGEVVRRR